MAQPFATVVIAYLFACLGCICSNAVVTGINFIFLNHFMGVYDSFWSVFDWSIDYKSVALPIELWGLERINKLFS